MQGRHLRLLPRLNWSQQEEGRSHGSSSSEAVEGFQGNGTLSNEAGTIRGHGGAPRVAGVWRRATAKHPAKDHQGRPSARQGTGWISKLVWEEERFS